MRKAEYITCLMSLSDVEIMLNVFNAEHLVDDFLKSLHQQTYKDFHLTVIDDGSTDKTVKKIEKYEDKFDLTIYKRPHMGLREARQFGINKTQARYIIILDADLILDKNAIKELIRPLNQDAVGAVGGILKGRGNSAVSCSYSLLRDFFYSLRTKDGQTDWVSGGFSAVKNEVINEIGGYPAGVISEDLDISWKIQKKGYKLILNEKAIAYHLDPLTLKEVWNREKNIGIREYHLAKKHPRKTLIIKRILRFYPLLTPFILPAIIIISLPIFLLLLILSVITISCLIKGSIKHKIMAWLTFNIMNFAYSTGFVLGFFKKSN